MARIEPLGPREWPPEMGEALKALTPPNPRHPSPPRDGRPKALNLLGTLARHPELAKAFLTFNGHVLMATTLSTRQRELLVLRVAAVRESPYEWAQHVVLGRDVGLDDEDLARIAEGPDADGWDALDAALLRAVDELVGQGAIQPGTWAALADGLDEQQLFDAIFTVGAYETLAWMLRSVEVDLDDDLEP